MLPFKIKTSLNNLLADLEFRQVDPLHPSFEVYFNKTLIADMYKENGKWYQRGTQNILHEYSDILGKAIDEYLTKHAYRK